jgi:immune inhibitor A
MFRTCVVRVTLAVLLLLVFSQAVLSAPPTREAIEKWIAEGVWEHKVAQWQAFKAAGGSQPPEHSPLDKQRDPSILATADVVDTVRVIVILVDFSDLPSEAGFAGQPNQFDSILFSNRETDVIHNPTGSMTDYYWENSYGKVLIMGDIFGWYEMPSSYEHYVGSDDGLTGGRELAYDAVVRAKNLGGADFSDYDNNNDGFCDGVIIIHAGAGAEVSGVYGIWSHQGSLVQPIEYDGVVVSEYTMNPEEAGSGGQLSAIGVFCHEYGHVLGLIDLYDVDYTPASSDGLGAWSLMASGNYNGNSRIPAGLDAASRIQLGWVYPTVLSSNLYDVEIPAVEYNPVIYKLVNEGVTFGEFWLVENRQPYGFDAALPAWGLFIYHVDAAAPGNTNYLRYYNALEQADGNNDLALTAGNAGDGGDPWPGATNNRAFHDQSVPNSHTNSLGVVGERVTQIAVWDISDSDSLMYADLDVTFSRPWETTSGADPFLFDDSGPGGDGDGYLEPGESIRFYATLTNLMRSSYNATLTLTTSRPEVTFLNNDVLLATEFNGNEHSNFTPIQFTLASAFVPIIDSFFLTVVSDSLPGTPGSGEFSRTFGLEVNFGLPQILIVDDDRGEDYDEQYQSIIHARRIPFEVWHKADAGSPSGSDLVGFPMVFWHTGDSAGNVFTAGDVAALKQYLDDDGNLFLSSISGAASIDAADASFLANYLGAKRDTSFLFPRFQGVPGNAVGDGTQYTYISGAQSNMLQMLDTVSGGQAAFKAFGRPEICGVTYAGSHHAVFITFPLEYLSDTRPGFNSRDQLIGRVLDFFGGIPTDVDDGRRTAPLPASFDLGQNYPNPFNPVTTIAYTLRPVEGQTPPTVLSIFNTLGQRVTTLVNERQIPGHYEIVWDGTSESGLPVASGVYFYRLNRGDDSRTCKMVLLK